DVHYGRAEIVLATRQAALDAAFAVRPERFPNGRPTVKPLPEAVYINQPENLLGTSDESAH
ncbi:MAG: IS3 family transposase, partial [Proteobacteria bacterium]|nr:IS3 family transposase [Pseudomonadota bacterium]